MHNIGLELINLSVLVLDYTHDEFRGGSDLLSAGGLSLKEGIYLLNASLALQTCRDTKVGKSHRPPAQGW